MKAKSANLTGFFLFFIPFLLFIVATGAHPASRVRLEKEAEGMNLLIITLDTMRADRIGAYGYDKAKTPHLDDLAKKGIMFAHC